jgi:protein gp37
MGDLFAPDSDFGNKNVNAFRRDVFHMMDQARQHQYFLLTKRAWMMKLVAEDCAPSPEDYQHVFWGISVTNQQEAADRIPLLLATPAAKRWVSIEPMLGPISFRWAPWQPISPFEHNDHLDGLRRLDWVVVGSIDRPSSQWPAPKREWIESIREQCKAAGVPLWEKNNLRRHGIVKDRPLVKELP